jgi:hypothetical protein
LKLGFDSARDVTGPAFNKQACCDAFGEFVAYFPSDAVYPIQMYTGQGGGGAGASFGVHVADGSCQPITQEELCVDAPLCTKKVSIHGKITWVDASKNRNPNPIVGLSSPSYDARLDNDYFRYSLQDVNTITVRVQGELPDASVILVGGAPYAPVRSNDGRIHQNGDTEYEFTIGESWTGVHNFSIQSSVGQSIQWNVLGLDNGCLFHPSTHSHSLNLEVPIPVDSNGYQQLHYNHPVINFLQLDRNGCLRVKGNLLTDVPMNIRLFLCVNEEVSCYAKATQTGQNVLPNSIWGQDETDKNVVRCTCRSHTPYRAPSILDNDCVYYATVAVTPGSSNHATFDESICTPPPIPFDYDMHVAAVAQLFSAPVPGTKNCSTSEWSTAVIIPDTMITPKSTGEEDLPPRSFVIHKDKPDPVPAALVVLTTAFGLCCCLVMIFVSYHVGKRSSLTRECVTMVDEATYAAVPPPSSVKNE